MVTLYLGSKVLRYDIFWQFFLFDTDDKKENTGKRFIKTKYIGSFDKGVYLYVIL